MGTFLGHIIPGTFFTLFSIWFAWSTFHRYFLCQKLLAERSYGKKGTFHRKRSTIRYRNTSTSPCLMCATNFPIDGLIKVVMVVIGMAGELVYAFQDGHFQRIGNAQHMTMFFFFGLNGAMDLLLYYRILISEDIVYLSGVLAFSMEGILFYYHVHGRPEIDILVHMLLVMLIVGCAVSVAMEMKYRNSIIPALGKIYFLTLQGTWFYQVAFILYPPNGDQWDPHNHRQMMIVTLIFAWHNAAVFIYLLLFAAATEFYTKHICRSTTAYKSLAYRTTEIDRHCIDDDEFKDILQTEDEEGV